MTRALQFKRRAARSGQARSLVVFLHGYGADGADLLGLADPLAPHLPDTAFVAPDAPERPAGSAFGHQWFPIPWLDGSAPEAAEAGLAAASADLDVFLDARLAGEGLAEGVMAVIGFSQGTMMALHVMARRHHAAAAIVGFSGRLLHPERLAAEARVRPPVLLLHGDADPVVPFADMDLSARALSAAGFQTSVHVMKGTGHGIAPDGLAAALAFLKDRLPG